ncbi:DUF3027 domain-containing protein [Paenarthrobacter sp. Z7-10]|nr:DUF3027 domain-containing protein [Paenarthrobacter sp. Z7-10]MCZ2402598.1 DUF3027 domain-containing protein [Paenarthrobacter sp. Z7-10]
MTDTEGDRPPAKPAGKSVGVPVWRTGKPDTVLAAAVGVAREGIRSIASEDQIGAHLAVRSEGERVATHLFECTMPGYEGWQWFAVLARVSRSKTASVNEVGLLPTERSVLAPEWVPWAARVRPEDAEAAAELAGLSSVRGASSDTTVEGLLTDGQQEIDDDDRDEDHNRDRDAGQD